MIRLAQSRWRCMPRWYERMGTFGAGQGMCVVGWTTSGAADLHVRHDWKHGKRGFVGLAGLGFCLLLRVRGFFPCAWSIHFCGHSLLGLLTFAVNYKKRIDHSLSVWITLMRIDHPLSCLMPVLDMSPCTAPGP